MEPSTTSGTNLRTAFVLLLVVAVSRCSWPSHGPSSNRFFLARYWLDCFIRFIDGLPSSWAAAHHSAQQ